MYGSGVGRSVEGVDAVSSTADNELLLQIERERECLCVANEGLVSLDQ